MGEQLAPRDHVSQEIAPSGGATPASGLWLCVSSLRPQRYRQVGQVLGRLAANRELFAIQVLNDAVERRIVDSDCWRNVARAAAQLVGHQPLTAYWRQEWKGKSI